jgi:hypothetical protein
MKKLKKGDIVYLKCEIHDTYTEKGVIGKKDNFYIITLPELLEYRFPEASMVMAIASDGDLYQLGELQEVL